MKAITIVTFTLLAVGVQAQTVRTLTVEEAIARATERSPDRLRTEALERQAELLRETASRFFDERPEIEFEYVTEKPFGGKDFELSLGVLQEIPIWGSASRRSELASAVESASKDSRQYLELAIATRTRILYNRAWSLAQQIELGNRLIATASKLTEATNKRLAVGDISRLERNTVALETNAIRIEHEQVYGDYEQAIGELEALTGLSLHSVILNPDNSTRSSLVLDTISAFRLSPYWVKLRGEVDIARARLELAKVEARENPIIGLHYAEDLLTIGEDDITYHESVSHNISGISAPGRSIGASLSIQIPITIPGLWRADNLEAIDREAELRSLEADLAELEIELSGRLARLRPKLSRATSALAIYQESVELIRENHDLIDRGYEGGEVSVTELLVGRQQLIDLQRQQLQLLRDMKEAEIELENILRR